MQVLMLVKAMRMTRKENDGEQQHVYVHSTHRTRALEEAKRQGTVRQAAMSV